MQNLYCSCVLPTISIFFGKIVMLQTSSLYTGFLWAHPREHLKMKFLLKQKKRSAVSPVIATLLLIAIAVAAAIIVYAFVTGLIGGLTTSSNGLVVISGSLTVPGGSGAGSLVVTIKNSASNPISAITIGTDAGDAPATVVYGDQNGYNGASTSGGYGGAAVCVFAATGTTVTACTAGSGVPSGSTLPIGQTVSAIGSTGQASAGTTYTFTVSVYFTGSNSPTIQTFSVTAQV
jgi:flagellin-like protein